MTSAGRTDNLAPAQVERLKRFHASASADVHCHCLPGLDDGPLTLEQAVALCRSLVADGITHVVATPHQLGRYEGRNSAADIRTAAQDLQRVLAKENVPLTIEPGADVRVDGRLIRLLDAGDILTLGDRRKAILLELPTETLPDIRALLRELRDRGIVPVLTHPERHQQLAVRPEFAAPWLEFGMVFQVTAGSLIGEFGPVAYRAAWEWLRRGLVSVIATDSHDARRRPPRMSAAIGAIESQLTHAAANRLCIQNPQRLWSGEPLPPAGGAAVLGRSI